MMLRRFLLPIVLAALVGCNSSPGEPVTTVDGQWSGVQNGYSLSFNLTQADTLVSGTVEVAGAGGAFAGTTSGTFKYPALTRTISIPGFVNSSYNGTMSSSEAKIFGTFNGGVSPVEIDVVKK